jgi:RNA polymerase sigma factor (sigma-70 family)
VVVLTPETPGCGGPPHGPEEHGPGCGGPDGPDPPCFPCFWRAHAETFRRWARQLCAGNDVPELAEDVLLAAREKLLRAWCRDIGNRLGYMHRILRNTARDAARGRGEWRHRLRPGDTPVDAERHVVRGGPDPVRAVLQAEVRREVAAALRRLPRVQRAVVDCLYVTELSPAETETYLGMTATAVGSALHRARKKLRAVLSPDLLSIFDDPDDPRFLRGGEQR